MWFGVTAKGRSEGQHTCGHALFSREALAYARPAGQCSMGQRTTAVTLWSFGSPIRRRGLSPPEWTPQACSRCDGALPFTPGLPKGDVVGHWSLNPESALLVPRNESFLFFLTNKNYK